MTSGSLSLTANAKAFGRSFNYSGSWSFKIPDKQLILPGPGGSSLVISVTGAVISFGLHVPVFGLIWSHEYSEVGSHAITEEYDGDTVTGTLALAA